MKTNFYIEPAELEVEELLSCERVEEEHFSDSFFSDLRPAAYGLFISTGYLPMRRIWFKNKEDFYKTLAIIQKVKFLVEAEKEIQSLLDCKNKVIVSVKDWEYSISTDLSLKGENNFFISSDKELQEFYYHMIDKIEKELWKS